PQADNAAATVPPCATTAARRKPADTGALAPVHAEWALLPDRHRPRGPTARPCRLVTPGAGAGRPPAHADIPGADGDAADRGRHHAPLRLERSRRRPDLERALAGRADHRPPRPGAPTRRRDADRRPLRRRLHRWIPDRTGTGAKASHGRRGHERRTA